MSGLIGLSGSKPRRQPGTYTFIGVAFMLSLTGTLLCSPCSSLAAPFAENIEFTQPDGVRLTLWGEGDEFRAVFETTTGYTVIFDPALRTYFYAELADDGKSLVSTGVPAQDPAPPALAQHLRIDPAAVAAAAKVRHEQWDRETGQSRRWSQLKSQTLGTHLRSEDVGAAFSPPNAPTLGAKTGLTLLIDFPDEPATISRAEIDSFLNGNSYSGYGNNGSVKEYFNDVSGNRLTYTNVTTIYIRMTEPKSYYDDTSQDSGTQGRLLLLDALAILKARSDYASAILPNFSGLTVDGDGNVLATNVFFSGEDSGVWAKGLWPCSYSLASPVVLGNGKSVSRFQISNIGSGLTLGTFCHENGHMLCGFPDIYDYEKDSTGGAGKFCLMNSGCFGPNPSQVSAYLKLVAGWATVTDLTKISNVNGNTRIGAGGRQ